MNKSPYIQPERELYYNLGIILLILGNLAETPRNKKVLTIEKIQSFYFLVTKPAFLNRVLALAGRRQICIEDVDYYTVETLSANIDELFDRERLLIMIKILSSKSYLSAEYSKADGFLFQLTDAGQSVAGQLKSGYFWKIKLFIEQLSSLQSQPSAKLNKYINTILKQGL